MNQVSVDFGKQTGVVRPLHGVNNGPRTYAFFHDTSKYFVEAGIPYARLHDTEYPYGSGHFVDVPCIFKDFDRDANDPASYDFALTDMYIKAIYDCGAKVFYRLGVSIEHAPVKRNIYAPKDPRKWALVCEHIVAHYNEGWADGFHYGIEYWEIWNEPETVEGTRREMWLGSDEQYFELYSITANRLKERFPSIKVGGYASCGFMGAFDKNLPREYHSYVEYAERFFTYINAPETKAPLDFFSWHIYSNDLKMHENCARYARDLLLRYGRAQAECILDEWNYAGEDMFNRMRTEVGASMVAGAMCVMQRNGIALGAYYDAQPSMCYCGIFSLEDQTPTKTFYTFKAWNELYKLATEVESHSDCPDVRVCAAGAGGKGGVLVSSYLARDGELSVGIRGLTGANGVRAKVYSIDKEHCFDLVSEETFFGGEIRFTRKKDGFTTLYIELEAL